MTELHVFQRWGHLSTSLVLEVYFFSCKPMDEVKFVQTLGMGEVVLEWIKCGSMVEHKELSCAVLNR